MYAEKLMPHDIDAEEAIIGSLLIDGESISKITPILKTEDFYTERNRWCFKSAISIFNRNESINQISISHELAINNLLENVGGNAYLAHLVQSVPTPLHIEQYAQIVHKTSLMRQLIKAADDIANIGYESDTNTDESLRKAEEVLFNVKSGRSSRNFLDLKEILDTYMEQSSDDPETAILQQSIPTGFPDIDKLLGGGLNRSDLVILAARPSMGKSTLAFNLARYVAGNNQTVGIFSLEMSMQQIAMRLISDQANINSHKMRLRTLSEEETTRELDAIGTLSELPIFIDDTPIQSILEMRGKAQRLKVEQGIDLLIVDYLQLISGSNRTENRVQEMGEISRQLKALARDLEIPVIACSQLSRAVEQRPSHRPILSDLRESGSIEQEADVVFFIYREDVYTTQEEWENSHPMEAYPENIAELICSKHRNGPIGTIPLYFQRDLTRFESLNST
ncbi:MAG: replicative DNA helicase [SAR202 cluster bacterium]|nr:replicative DNA helicase [SAR202 cluster bacterium]